MKRGDSKLQAHHRLTANNFSSNGQKMEQRTHVDLVTMSYQIGQKRIGTQENISEDKARCKYIKYIRMPFAFFGKYQMCRVSRAKRTM